MFYFVPQDMFDLKKKLGDAKNCIHTYYLFTGGSLPDKLDRHPWYLDFPRWHDTRKGNSDRTFASAAQLKAATMQNDVSLTNLKLQFLSTYLHSLSHQKP